MNHAKVMVHLTTWLAQHSADSASPGLVSRYSKFCKPGQGLVSSSARGQSELPTFAYDDDGVVKQRVQQVHVDRLQIVSTGINKCTGI